MNVSLWIARRLRLRGSGSSTVGVVIAVAGVALALVIMQLTVAVVLGFKDGIRSRLMGFDAQITIEAPFNTYGSHFEATATLDSLVRAVLPGAELRQAIRQPALLKTDNDFHGLVFLGQSDDSDFSFEKSNITDGSWPAYGVDSCENIIVISRSVADALGLGVGDKVTSTFFIDGSVRMRRHTVGALFASNFGEYDTNIAYASLSSLRKIAGLDSCGVGRLDIRGLSLDEIEPAAARLQDELVNATVNGTLRELYPVTTVFRTGALYFSWLDLLDTNVVVIFVLMLAVSALTLVSSLFILILERVSFIGVLRAIGADKPMVRRIFVDMAMRIVGAGMVAGNIVSLAVMYAQWRWHILPLDPVMYYLDAVPVRFSWWAIIGLNIGVTLVAWLILILPARLASSVDPAKAISYE